MLIKWRTTPSRAAESRRLVGSLKLVYLPAYFPNAGMSIVVFDRLLYGHAEEGSLLQGRKLWFGKCGKFSGTVLYQFGHSVLAFPQ
jgi:hypothetical protein